MDISSYLSFVPRSVSVFSRAALLSAAAMSLAFGYEADAQSSHHSAGAPDPKTITLPAAHVGVGYKVHIHLTGADFGAVEPVNMQVGNLPDEVLNAGLHLDPKTFNIQGIPTVPLSLMTFPVVISDSVNSVTLNLSLAILNGPEEVFIQGSQGSQPAISSQPLNAQRTRFALGNDGKPLPVIESALEIIVSTPPVEGSSLIQGAVLNLPATDDPKALKGLQVELRLKRGNGVEQPDALKYKTGSGLEYRAPVNEDDGTFTLSLDAPLPPGVIGRIELLHPAVSIIQAVTNKTAFTIPLDLPKPSITVAAPIKAGTQTIEGSAFPMPSPAIPKNASASPPVLGNLPSVMVMVHNPKTPNEDWYPAQQQIGTATATVDRQEIQKDGTFKIQLKTALATGQEVRVKLLPPPGREFIQNGQRTAEVESPAVSGILPQVPSSHPARSAQPAPMLSLAAPAFQPELGSELPPASVPALSQTSSSEQTSALPHDQLSGSTEAVSEDPLVAPPVDLVPPSIKTHDEIGKGTITGSATPSADKDNTINIAVLSDDTFEDLARENSEGTVPACITAKQAASQANRFLSLAAASPTGNMVATSATGDFSLTLATPLSDGQRYYLVEILPASWTEGMSVAQTRNLCRTTISIVRGSNDWGRTHADFAAGVLISNDSANSTVGSSTAGSGNFSQAHQFYALSLEKDWSLPKCYIRIPSHLSVTQSDNGEFHGVKRPDQCYDWGSRDLYSAKRWQHLWPGFNTYFQTRLTAIPISMLASKATSTTGTTAPASASSTAKFLPAAAAPDATTSTTTPTSNLLSTAQTARVEVGSYLPFLIGRWEYENQPNALFVAPLAKVGFDTVTGPSTVNTISPDGTTILSQTFEQLYDFWSYGARVGHMELSRSQSRAPEIFSYLDISFGPYSSLQSYICHPGPFPTTSTTTGGVTITPTNSKCSEYTDGTFGVDSRKRIYRLDIEGLLKIPKTDFYLGLNANIGQRSLGAVKLDRGFSAADDLRFFFGTKFDIATLLNKFNLGTH